MRIVFMGTPEFSIPCLDILNNSNHEIVAVVTATDKPAGRGKKLKSSAIKKYAVENNLNLLQPEKLKNQIFIDNLKNLNADIFIVIAFRMLPKIVWNIPRYGTVNLHASLLPNYRGAAPINWAIINGEKESGITTFFINEEIDKGSIILQESIKIEDKFSAGDLHDIMMIKGAKLILETVNKIENNSVKEIEQDVLTKTFKTAPKLSKDICKIKWNSSAKSITNHIRGLNPFPGAWTTLTNGEINKHFKIFSADISNEIIGLGILKIINNQLYIGCNNGSIRLIEVQIEGKKRMLAEDFIKGNIMINNYYTL
ncbi:MAG: methionyl-tRNA formyltransferase [Crocinitomicaceae bacterium]|nr:methionyl-tRNA formyltransferase [Crocinitomicaceae bacterium]